MGDETDNALARSVLDLSKDSEAWMKEGGPISPDEDPLAFIDLGQADCSSRSEVLQFLAEFSYTDKPLKSDWWTISNEEIERALNLFYAEAEQFDQHFAISVPPEKQVHMKMPQADLAPEVFQNCLLLKPTTLNKIQSLLGLDGDLDVSRLPQDGEVSLVSRLLYYRLKIYGVIDQELAIKEPWDSSYLEKYQVLSVLCCGTEAPKDLLSWVNEIGDISQVATRVKRRYRESGIILERHGKGWVPKKQREQNRALLDSPETFSKKALPKVSKRVRLKTLHRGHLVESQWNRFGIRFLQIALWYDGYYHGELDGVWGRMSHRALLDAAKAEGLFYKKRQRPIMNNRPLSRKPASEGILFVHRRFVIFEKRNYFQIELSSFISELLELDQKQEVQVESDLEFGIQTLNDAMAQSSPGGPNSQDEHWAGLIKESYSQKFAAAEQVVMHRTRPRRRYFGLGALKRSVSRFRKWVVAAVKSAKRIVRDLFRWVKGPLLRILGFIKGNILRAVNTARLALKRLTHYITGRPYLSVASEGGLSGFIVTKYSIDQDAYEMSNRQADKVLFERHRAMIRMQNKALEETVVFTVRVAKLIAAGVTPLGWASLAWKVFKIFRDLFLNVSRKNLAQPFRSMLAIPV